jgi:hypothetical protein
MGLWQTQNFDQHLMVVHQVGLAGYLFLRV